MDKFKVGQKVKIIYSVNYPEYIGLICTIIKKRNLFFSQYLNKHYLGYTVDMLDKLYAPLESHLQAIYDGDEKSSWSESQWKPKELEKI